jgi:acetyl esterase/lipase
VVAGVQPLRLAVAARRGGAGLGRCARAEDLSGLPQTFIDVGDLDLFAVECIRYAERLVRAGVPTDLHVVAGAVHGYIYAGDDLMLCHAHRERVRAFLAKA